MLKCGPNQRATVRTTVDGRAVVAEVSSRLLLSDFLRADCGATGVHVGCEQGVCGACTVRVDGRAARSCLMFALQADGADIETVASLGTRDALHPLQARFQAHHALQCGFCTPGILMSAVAYLAENQGAAEGAIREMLGGHLCRCTGYAPIVAAIVEQARDR